MSDKGIIGGKMKKLKTILMIAGALTIMSAMTSCKITNEAPERVKTISVSGTGSVQVKPDQLSLTFVVKSREWNVNTATTGNATITERVINALKDAGVDSSDISTHDYRITQETYWENNREYPGRYNVTNTIRILVRNTDLSGAIIDAAVRAGANGLTGFEYLVSDTTSALRQARTLAVQNAQDAASLFAGASGVKVNEVLDISEGSNYTSRSANSKVMYLDVASEGVGATTPIETGTVTVTASVNITYSLQ